MERSDVKRCLVAFIAITTSTTLATTITSAQAIAAAPILQSASPVIYLADNLDEKDQLGWCIDTEGRGFAETLQAHSCKPAGDLPKDTQFHYNSATKQIRSVAFDGKCMDYNQPSSSTHPFGLLDCQIDASTQHFNYLPKSQQIVIDSNKSLCVVVAPQSISAGPFMSRDLTVANCDSVEDRYKQWVIKK